MALRLAECMRLRALLEELRDGTAALKDAKVPVAAWTAGLALSIACITTAACLRQRLGFRAKRRQEEREAAPTGTSVLWCALGAFCCAICLLYPGAVLHTYFRRRVSKEATGFRPACARQEFARLCTAECERLLARPAARADQVTRALFIALICFIPCMCCALPVSSWFAMKFADTCWRRLSSKGDSLQDKEHYASAVAVIDEAAHPSPGDEVSHPLPVASRPDSHVLVHVSRIGRTGLGDRCSICLEHFWTRKNVKLPCSHRFHQACVRKWLDRAPVACCPLCKAPVESVENKGVKLAL